jgi:hypothetical protein
MRSFDLLQFFSYDFVLDFRQRISSVKSDADFLTRILANESKSLDLFILL